MRLQYLQRVQLSMKPSGAFTSGVVVTVGMMVLVLYLRSRRRTVAAGAEQFLGEADY